MIKVTGQYFRRTETSKSVLPMETESLFLFIQFFGSEKGETSNQAEIWFDQEGEEKAGTPFLLPRYTAQELEGGQGENEYCKLLDKMQDLIIANLQILNPDCTFEKI